MKSNSGGGRNHLTAHILISGKVIFLMFSGLQAFFETARNLIHLIICCFLVVVS